MREGGRAIVVAAMALVLGSGVQAGWELEPKKPVALARGGNAGSCHCPCKVGQCDCTMHGETCHRCYTLEVRVAPGTLAAILDAGPRPVLHESHAGWFETAPHPQIEVFLAATMRDTGENEAMAIRFVPEPDTPSRYVPDGEFDAEGYAAWARRVDRSKEAALTVATKDDPGSWRIVDGDLDHLNHSLRKSFELARADGARFEVFRSESTLGWEANLYLRSVVAGIADAALQQEAARGELLEGVDLVDLQLKTGDAEGAVRTLDRLIASSETTWLDATHGDFTGAVCGLRKIRNLLVPGSRCS